MDETKKCQNCGAAFIIDAADFSFYEKLKVPPPTWCIYCRHQRRLIPRNERTLYKRKCSLCKKDMIAIYPEDVSFPVYCYECWWSDKWNPLDYGRDYDFSRPFFEQYQELQNVVPRLALQQSNSVNSPYVNHTAGSKNCYLIFNSVNNENCYYGNIFFESKDCFDGWNTHKGELTYETVDCTNAYALRFSEECYDSSGSSFLYNCVGVQDSFLAFNLKNKTHHIENMPYSKEEYEKRLAEYQNGSYKTLQENIKRYRGFKANRIIHKYRIDLKTDNSTGNYLFNCHNCKFCFTGEDQEYCSYVFDSSRNKDCMDHSFIEDTELSYEGMSLYRDYGVRFSYVSWYDRELDYCALTFNSQDCFGCISLNKVSYCVLNKRYSEEEYRSLRGKIIDQMRRLPYRDSKGRVYSYGEFFPPDLSPFAYNETVANEYFPLTKEEILSRGYRWREPEGRQYQITLTVDKLPDNIRGVADSILDEVIGCVHEGKCKDQCTTAFKIVPQELDFYRKMKLPIPRLCPNCRHYQRLAERNPIKLWHRKCQCAGEKSDNRVYANETSHFHGQDHCPNEFETSYAPERSEIVYCEACYQSEVV